MCNGHCRKTKTNVPRLNLSLKVSDGVYIRTVTHERSECAVALRFNRMIHNNAEVNRKCLPLANRWRGNPDVSITRRPATPESGVRCRKGLQTRRVLVLNTPLSVECVELWWWRRFYSWESVCVCVCMKVSPSEVEELRVRLNKWLADFSNVNHFLSLIIPKWVKPVFKHQKGFWDCGCRRPRPRQWKGVITRSFTQPTKHPDPSRSLLENDCKTI